MPQQLFIPSLGSIIVLTEPWNFKLFFESRNNSLLKALCPTAVPPLPDGLSPKSWQAKYHAKLFGTHFTHHEDSPLLKTLKPLSEKELADAHPTYRTTNSKIQYYLDVTLPAGQQLKFDRLYIRQSVTAFNSVTFRTTKIGPDKKFHSKRFWVKLQDANTIVCNILG